MTLLFFDGFREVEATLRPEWAAAFNNAVGRDGSTNGAAATARGSINVLTLPSSASTCILGCGILFNSTAFGSTVSTGSPIQFVRSGTVELVVQLTAAGFLEVRKTNATGTLVGTTSGHSAFTIGNFKHVQIKTVLHSSSGSIEIKIDGGTYLSLSGVSTAVTSGAVTAINIGSANSGSGTNNAVRVDDLWVCDGVDATSTQGRPNNDYLGDLKVATLVPNGAGDLTFWTPSTGANYAAVDEMPPNTTDYVSAPSTVDGVRDLYALQDLPGTASEIFGMLSTVAIAKSDVGYAKARLLVKQDGVVGTDSSLLYVSGVAPAYVNMGGDVRTVRASDLTPLTVADVNATQVGFEVSS